jgi:hypothetical protein
MYIMRGVGRLGCLSKALLYSLVREGGVNDTKNCILIYRDV